MSWNYFKHQALFVLRFRYLQKCNSFFRKQYYILQGMRIGKETYFSKVHVTWPNQVSIGNRCIIEHDVYFKFEGIWKEKPSIILHNDVFIGSGCEFNISGKVEIGNKAMIASGCKFIDHDHGTSKEIPMNFQSAVIAPIIIEEEVWLGANVIVLKGIKIGKGAVVAAGSVVTKSISDYEIWAGVPAKYIKHRT